MRNADILLETLCMQMVYPRDVLNKLRWKECEELEEAVIWYIHRGAPGDFLRISGKRISKLGRSFFDTDEATIPYHRILRIDYRGETLFLKNDEAKSLTRK